jgi:hypothetical protein
MALLLSCCRFYQKLSGMTGTAKSAAAEFYEIYGLRVVPIPTNKPPRRQDLPLRLYYTEKVMLALMIGLHAVHRAIMYPAAKPRHLGHIYRCYFLPKTLWPKCCVHPAL